MDGLEVPQPLSRLGVHRDDRVRKEIVAGAVGAIEIVMADPSGMYRMPRSSSTVKKDQVLAPLTLRQESSSQVSLPTSPGRGTV